MQGSRFGADSLLIDIAAAVIIQNESEIAEEEENMLTTIEILENCCQDVGARKNVANSIFALTMRGSFKDKSKEEILRAIGMLKLCIKDDSSKARKQRKNKKSS